MKNNSLHYLDPNQILQIFDGNNSFKLKEITFTIEEYNNQRKNNLHHFFTISHIIVVGRQPSITTCQILI